MEFTIAELARAVNKSETYVRQHVNRKHLAVRKEGRRVLVSFGEAARWARARGLSFASPLHASLAAGKLERRTARMTVLAWRGPDEHHRNLFTLLRHRRHDALGPWASETSGTWSEEDLDNELALFSFEGSFDHCQALVDQILNSRTLEIGDLAIQYALEPVPRRHMACRDSGRLADASVPSPFKKHSAHIIEYWSFAEESYKRWLEVLESLPGKAPAQLARLGFELDRRPDRAGNLMVAGAEDAISCELFAYRDQTLRFHVSEDKLLPDAYRAAVWASHSGDEVVRQEVPVNPGQTVIQLVSDVDRIGFAVHRTSDGRCIDMMEEPLIMEVHGRMTLSGPTVHLRNRQSRSTHQISPFDNQSIINVEFDRDSAELDKGIRRQWLRRRVYEREAAARREGNFARFGPEEFDKAVQYFLNLLRQYSDGKQPIYLADRYFMGTFAKDKKEQLEKLYLDIFAATTGRPLLILCTQKDDSPSGRWLSYPDYPTNHVRARAFPDQTAGLQNDGNLSPWWSNYPNYLTSHVRVRAFHTKDGQPGFHDRYLVTPECEVLITHSLNGWPRNGVTFVRLPYDIYRAEAKWLWSLDIHSAVTPLLIREIC